MDISSIASKHGLNLNKALVCKAEELYRLSDVHFDSFVIGMYLQAQSRNRIFAYLAAFSLILHVSLSYITVMKLHMSVFGAMGSMILAMWIPILDQFMFLLGEGYLDTWKGFSWSAFTDLWPVIKLSLSSGVMIYSELWYNTVLILLIGYIKNAEVEIDALSICLNINGWEMMISLGFLAAAGVRVANELRAGSAKRAKFAILVVVCESLSIGTIIFVLFLVFRGHLAYVFTMLMNGVQLVLSATKIRFLAALPASRRQNTDFNRPIFNAVRHEQIIESMKNLNLRTYVLAKRILDPP